MTRNTTTSDKLRGLILASLMVFSVFAGSIAFAGSAAANAPDTGTYAAGNAPGGDDTPTTDTTQGLTTEIADVGFNTPGNVTYVEVDANNGSNAAGIDTSDIESISVILLNNNDEVVAESGQVIYDQEPTNVSFAGTSAADGDQVGRMQVLAKVSSSASDGDVIDAGVLVGADDGTTFEGNSPYDTAGTQTVRVTDTFASASVKRTGSQGSTVEDANVSFVNTNTGTVIAQRQTSASGGTASVRVAPGVPIRADANKGGFTKSSSTVASVPVGESLELDVTITPEGVPENIEIIAAEPSSESVLVGNSIDYYVQVTGQFGNQNNQPLNGFDVDSAVVTDPDSSTVSLSPGTDTTQQVVLPDGSTANGTAVFTVSDSETEQANISFTVSENTTLKTFAQPNFRPESGDARLQGEVVTNESEIVQGATVWVAYRGENQTLAYAQQTQPYLVSDVNSEGKYTIEGIVPPTETGEVNVYVDANGYNRLNRTAQFGAYVAADETETVTSGQTENHDFTLFAGGPAQEYRLDVLVEGQKSVELPAGSQATATISVEQRAEGSSEAYEPAANKEINVQTTNAVPLDPDDLNVTTDSNGEAQVTYQAVNSDTTNITALTENEEGDVYNTTGSQQAEVSVFASAELTGDVVNEDDEPLAAGQAQVRLYQFNGSAYEFTGDVSEVGSSGAYVFTGLRSNQEYRVIATTDTGLTGQATTAAPIPEGTTTNDIVVVGADPSPAAFNVTDLNPTDVTVTQGDNITVSATITNDGRVDATQTVEFRAGGNAIRTQSVSLQAGNSTTVTFENVSTAGLAPGDYTHGVFSQDDSQTATLTVESSDDGSMGDVSQQDVINAIVDFNSGGDTTQQEIIDLIVQFNSQN